MNKYTIPKLLTEYAADFQLNIGGGNGLDKYFEVITKEDVVKAYTRKDDDSKFFLIVNKPAYISIATQDFDVRGFVLNMLLNSEDNLVLMQHVPLAREVAGRFNLSSVEDMPFVSICGSIAQEMLMYTRLFAFRFDVHGTMSLMCPQLANIMSVPSSDMVEIPISEVPEFFAVDLSFDADAVAQALPV